MQKAFPGMTSVLARRKPDPIPAIHPVPEYLAGTELRALYEDTKAILQVPWMGVVTMALASYPTFYATLWNGLRELAVSNEFVTASATLRSVAESSATRLRLTDLTGSLGEAGYAARELEEIRALIEVFSHGNMPYLMIATAARLLLEGHSLSEERTVSPYTKRQGLSGASRLVLMEPHHADAPTRAVFEEIKRRLGLPFVNTDYRALARWPSYFALAWRDLKTAIDAPEYETLASSVHDAAVSGVLSLPNPGRLAPVELISAAERDASLEEIRDVVRLFQWLLPGLVINVAGKSFLFRMQAAPRHPEGGQNTTSVPDAQLSLGKIPADRNRSKIRTRR